MIKRVQGRESDLEGGATSDREIVVKLNAGHYVQVIIVPNVADFVNCSL